MTSLRQGGQGYTHLRSSHRVGALYVHADAKRKWIRVYIGRYYTQYQGWDFAIENQGTRLGQEFLVCLIYKASYVFSTTGRLSPYTQPSAG